MSRRDNASEDSVDAMPTGCSPLDFPLTDEKTRYCRICGKKLSIYNINSRYCFAHKAKGVLLEDKEADAKNYKNLKDKRYKDIKRYKKGKK